MKIMTRIHTLESEIVLQPMMVEKHFAENNSIEVDNVTVSFKTPGGVYTAVKNISLSVKKGEIVSLMFATAAAPEPVAWLPLNVEWSTTSVLLREKIAPPASAPMR